MSLVLVSDKEWLALPRPGLACSSLANKAGSMAQTASLEVGELVAGLKAKGSPINTSSTISHKRKGGSILDTNKELVNPISIHTNQGASRGTGSERDVARCDLCFVIAHYFLQVFPSYHFCHILHSSIIPPSCMSYYILGPLAVYKKQIALHCLL